MQDDKIIDTTDNIDIDAQLKKDRRKYLIRIGGLIIFNTIMFVVFIKGGRGFTGNLLAALNANLIGFNILGFILGTIVAIFPYKGLAYSKKYLRASILTLQNDFIEDVLDLEFEYMDKVGMLEYEKLKLLGLEFNQPRQN